MARQRRTAAARRAAAARRTDTKDPSRSRERALRVLFQADVRGVAPSVTLARLDGDPAARALLDERDVLTDGEPVLPDPSGPAPETTVGGAKAGASGWTDSPATTQVEPLDGFTRALVRGVEEHRVEVEALISRYARRWAISRMPVVDRNVLRLATYELLHEQTPPAVVLDEAIDLAKRLSTDDSGRFVNGVLESIRQQLAEEAAAEPADASTGAPDVVSENGSAEAPPTDSGTAEVDPPAGAEVDPSADAEVDPTAGAEVDPSAGAEVDPSADADQGPPT